MGNNYDVTSNNYDIIWALSDLLRSVFALDKATPAVIRLVFIKYAADNYLYAESKEEMRLYADLQKSIAGRNVQEFVDSSSAVLDMIDRKIHANEVLARAYSAYPHDLLMGVFKKSNNRSTFTEQILSELSTYDLSESDENAGQLYDALKVYVYRSLSIAGKYGSNGTNESLNSLAKKVLNVKENDTFMDFACGYGLSALEITNGNAEHLYLSDIDEENLQIAIMISIIQGKAVEKTTFKLENIYKREETPHLVSKAFTDFPLAPRLDKTEYPYSDGTIFAIHRLVESLDENGRSMITVHPGLLYKTNKETNEFRDYLIENGLLEAIVTLPPIIAGTTVNLCLLVLSKKKNTDVLFVDASNNDIIQFSNNARSAKSDLLDTGVDKLAEIILEKEEIMGVSKRVSNAEVQSKNTFVPASFIETPKPTNAISSKEINDKLNDLYEQLFKAQKNL